MSDPDPYQNDPKLKEPILRYSIDVSHPMTSFRLSDMT